MINGEGWNGVGLRRWVGVVGIAISRNCWIRFQASLNNIRVHSLAITCHGALCVHISWLESEFNKASKTASGYNLANTEKQKKSRKLTTNVAFEPGTLPWRHVFGKSALLTVGAPGLPAASPSVAKSGRVIPLPSGQRNGSKTAEPTPMHPPAPLHMSAFQNANATGRLAARTMKRILTTKMLVW